MRDTIVFLDISGVLRPLLLEKEDYDNPWGFGTEQVELLKQPFDAITDTGLPTKVGIVVTSTERFGSDESWDENIRSELAAAGWPNAPIIDRTPDMRDKGRGEEIYAWLVEQYGENFDEHVVYAIVDDEGRGILPEQEPMLISVNGLEGFSKENAKELRVCLSRWTNEEWLEAIEAAQGLGDVYVINRFGSEEEMERQMNEAAEAIAGHILKNKNENDPD